MQIVLKNGRSSGPFQYPWELVKYGSEKLFNMLKNLFQKCLNTSEVPEEWKLSYLKTIHKNGDKGICDNYRGIVITGTISRVYGMVLKNRIEKEYTGGSRTSRL